MDQCFDLTIVPLMIINIDGDLINYENQHKPEHNWLTVTIIFDLFFSLNGSVFCRSEILTR